MRQFWSSSLCAFSLVLLAAAGCVATHGVESPQRTLRRYLDALERDDSKIAYQLLSSSVQRSLPYDQFVRQWRVTDVERAAQAQQLHAQLRIPGAVQVRALLMLPHGVQVALLPASGVGRWHIDDADLTTVHMQAPEELLRLLLTAAEQRSYWAVLRLLTPAQQQTIESELRERIERLRAALSHPGTIPKEMHGDRLRYQYDPRFFIELHRETTGWRVVDLN